MFPGRVPLVAGYWIAAAAVGTVYLLLFVLTSRLVSLRPRRLGVYVLVVLAGRLALVAAGRPAPALPEAVGGIVGLVAGVLLVRCERWWLLRAEAGVLRAQVEGACRGLFLECTEPAPGRLVLTAKGRSHSLRLIALSRRLQAALVPPTKGPGKVALFVAWLSKQYPGPVPRIRVVLKKE